MKMAESFSFWDAMLVEAARTAGVTRLLSEDMQNGRIVGALHIENPLGAALLERRGATGKQ
jgi:predicted nucleic acid-binding protein